MDGAGAHPGGGVAVARPARDWLGWLLPPATALVIIYLGVLLLAEPLWMHFALQVSGSGIPAISPDQSLQVSDATVNQLLFMGDFDIRLVTGNGPSYVVYTDAERAHLRDARLVLYLFMALALPSLVLFLVTMVHRPKDARHLQAVARGGGGLAVGAVIFGVIGYFAFGIGFELFHRIFFPGGNWEFPADSNLIRLYPYAFWQLTAAALGVLCVFVGGFVWWSARRAAARIEG